MFNKTITISIDGLDGSGKSTIVRELNRLLGEIGFSSKILRSPVAPLQSIQDQVEEVGGLPAMLYYLSGNVLSLEMEFIEQHKSNFIIFDRHIFSTLAYFYSEDWKTIYDVCRDKLQKPDVSFLVCIEDDEIRTARLVERGLTSRSDHLSTDEAQRIEQIMRSFDLIVIDNSSDDNGISAAKSILEFMQNASLLNNPS